MKFPWQRRADELAENERRDLAVQEYIAESREVVILASEAVNRAKAVLRSAESANRAVSAYRK